MRADRTCVGLRCKDGVVLGVEKLVESKLLVKQSNKRLATADLHVGVVRCASAGVRGALTDLTRRTCAGRQASAGLAADGRALVALARSQAEQYRDFYHAPIPGKVLADRMALHVQAYTLYSSVRPYGAAVLLAVVDRQHDPQLYMIEPSGVYYVRAHEPPPTARDPLLVPVFIVPNVGRVGGSFFWGWGWGGGAGCGQGYFGCAIGKGKQLARTEIEKLKLTELSCRDALKEVARMYVHRCPYPSLACALTYSAAACNWCTTTSRTSRTSSS
jgi:20S proteasome alpha/beta subunit